MIKIDQEKCIGCGLCESICPKVFKLNSETGKADVIGQDAEGCDMDKAIESCAVSAISKS